MHSDSSHAASAAQRRKQLAAEAVLALVPERAVLGVGTGSTVNVLIDLIGAQAARLALRGAVSSSEASSARLRAYSIDVLDLNDTGELPLYIDGADEATRSRALVKGGGAALTREKILAAAARRFVCILDDSKLVGTLGRFPLPVEVIPMARNYVAGRIESLSGRRPLWRPGVITDNGNQILDVHGLTIEDPCALEDLLNGIVGVVTVGLFARRPADLLIVGTAHGVEEI
ncbi:MAG TPA: ribose-5-phosphate isomerase RpiA [Steroidobacteraceae bacterium]|jgi:ribose 5-phosphate isomerase A